MADPIKRRALYEYFNDNLYIGFCIIRQFLPISNVTLPFSLMSATTIVNEVVTWRSFCNLNKRTNTSDKLESIENKRRRINTSKINFRFTFYWSENIFSSFFFSKYRNTHNYFSKRKWKQWHVIFNVFTCALPLCRLIASEGERKKAGRGLDGTYVEINTRYLVSMFFLQFNSPAVTAL